jgi:hypothetical protein
MTWPPKWRRELQQAVLSVPGVTPLPTCQTCGRQVPVEEWDAHAAGHRVTPVNLLELHDAILDETIGGAGPRTFLRILGEIVATKLGTRDPATVQGAIQRLVDRGLVRRMNPGDEWDPRGMWWVEAF